MKNSIILEGTKNQLTNLKNAIEHSDNEMPTEVETIVFVVDNSEHNTYHLTDEQYMVLCKKYGRSYNLAEFQEAFKLEEVNTAIDVIRFINVPLKN